MTDLEMDLVLLKAENTNLKKQLEEMVRVVRCLECKHCLVNLKIGDGLCMKDIIRKRVSLDDYCSSGERKDGAESEEEG